MTTASRTERLVLPWPPSVNAWVRAIPRGRIAVNILTERARGYKSDVKRTIGFWPIPLQGALAMTIELCPPDRRRRDVDNFDKAILDSLTAAGVWGDDSQVIDRRTVFGDVIRGGQAICTISEVRP